mmetsp:Transcript_9701/g.22636  ORF Transcript_9701/g.22636 Transcript_9701/m.22636 type:complete len:235 (-) Transcript_9701:722-1426(-)
MTAPPTSRAASRHFSAETISGSPWSSGKSIFSATISGSSTPALRCAPRMARTSSSFLAFPVTKVIVCRADIALGAAAAAAAAAVLASREVQQKRARRWTPSTLPLRLQKARVQAAAAVAAGAVYYSSAAAVSASWERQQERRQVPSLRLPRRRRKQERRGLKKVSIRQTTPATRARMKSSPPPPPTSARGLVGQCGAPLTRSSRNHGCPKLTRLLPPFRAGSRAGPIPSLRSTF